MIPEKLGLHSNKKSAHENSRYSVSIDHDQLHQDLVREGFEKSDHKSKIDEEQITERSH